MTADPWAQLRPFEGRPVVSRVVLLVEDVDGSPLGLVASLHHGVLALPAPPEEEEADHG